MKKLMMLLLLVFTVNVHAEHTVKVDQALDAYMNSASIADTFKCGDEVVYLQNSSCSFGIDSMGCSSGCELPVRWKEVTWKVECTADKGKRILAIDSKYSFADQDKYEIDEKNFTAKKGNATSLVWATFFNPKRSLKSKLNAGGDTTYSVQDIDGSKKDVGAKSVSGQIVAFSGGNYYGEADVHMKVSKEVPGIGNILSVEICGETFFRLSKIVNRGE